MPVPREVGKYDLNDPLGQERFQIWAHLSGTKYALRVPYDRIIAAVGFVFDKTIFDETADPIMRTPRFPAMDCNFQSVNVEGMYYAGALMPRATLNAPRAVLSTDIGTSRGPVQDIGARSSGRRCRCHV